MAKKNLINSVSIDDNVPLAKIFFPRNIELEEVPAFKFYETSTIDYDFIIFGKNKKETINLEGFEIHFQIVLRQFRKRTDDEFFFTEQRPLTISIFSGINQEAPPQEKNILLDYSTVTGFIDVINAAGGHFRVHIENNQIPVGDHYYNLYITNQENLKKYTIRHDVMSICKDQVRRIQPDPEEGDEC